MIQTRLVVAGVVAAVSVSAAVFVLSQDRTTTTKRITDASPSAPGVAWVTDTSSSGLEGATFSDPRAGSLYPYGAGSIRIDDSVLTLAVVEDDLVASDAVLMSVDATSGAVEWTVPAGDLASCAEQPIDGHVVCLTPTYGENPGLVTYDLDTGESAHHDSGSDIFAMTVADGSVYTLEGNLEDGDITLQRGTLDDIAAQWTVPLQASAGWEDQYVDRLVVDGDTGHFDVGGGFSTFDTATGEQIWASDVLDDCLSGSHRTAGDVTIGSRIDCDSYGTVGTVALSRTGDVIVESKSQVPTYLTVDEPTDTSIPIVLGDSAYDRISGQKLWSNDELVVTRPADEYNEASTYGSLTAVIGDVGILSGDTGMVGLDLRTGERVWESAQFSLIGTDGSTALGARDGNLIAVDTRTGDEVWTAPFSNIAADDSTIVDTFVSGADGEYVLQSGSALVGLVSLPS